MPFDAKAMDDPVESLDHMTSKFDVVIVGGGHAGAQAAVALRQRKFEGTIAVLGEEMDLPYERPALSKEYLSGEKPFERLLLRPEAFWAERDIAVLTGRRVVSIDAVDHSLTSADGQTWSYGILIWAAGGRPRRLTCAGQDLSGVHCVRSRADVDQILKELEAVRDVVVIGGGYIGLEAAAVLTKDGKSVTVLEAQDRVLARVAGEPLSRFYEAEHRAHGVDVQLGSAVDCIEGEEGRVTAVKLADGTRLAAQMVVVGIGIIPCVEPLLAAGAEGGPGVNVDGFCRTTLPNVYAIGDCAAHPNGYAQGAVIRVESVQNANDQAATVARGITGDPSLYEAVPWFWSNQYDLRLQTVGLSLGYDQTIQRGETANRSFSIVYLKQGRVIALDCVNAVKDYVQGKALVMSGARVALDQLADPGVALKSLLVVD